MDRMRLFTNGPGGGGNEGKMRGKGGENGGEKPAIVYY